MGASAIAVTPVVAPNATTALPQVQSHAYDLTAALNATASPLEIYGSVFNETFNNLSLLGSAVVNDPAPLLSQVLENQKGYLEKIFGAFGSIPTSVETWWEGSNGKARLDMARVALEAGDLGEAYRWFNHSMLYAFNAAFGPLIAPGVFLSGIPRGGTEYFAGIPEQIAQNFTNLVAATFTRAVVVTGLFQGVFGTISGAVFELTRVVGATVEAISKGDIVGALNAVINTPAILANAVLNGFDYADEDPETGTGGYAEWPALLTFAEPGETGAVAGLFQTLLINIPKQLAAAIAPPAPTTTTALVSEVPAGVLDAPALETVDPEPTVELDKVEPAVEKAAPVVELVKVESPAPVSTDVEEGTASEGGAASLEGDTEGKTTAADRIKAKISEAKEAREARAQVVKERVEAAKEKAAAAREARAEKRAGAAKESKSSDSTDSGSSSSSSSGGSDSDS
ncbi:hypothetical protein AWB99_26095 [Mycolicibacterium confluentis]|nr:hypothetical protein [Mycolicibacterium confluentis]ORV22501.1 hypothetical protein AWB99_26095 [Mycolicibacterium confluentis]